jgi:PAS domain S-box-containing protein
MVNILTVDDELNIRQIIEKILTNNGFTCAVASNVTEARDLLAQQHFELVLLDLEMPGESGMVLLEELHSQAPNTVVVMVSVLSDPSVAHATLELGAYGYVPKPFGPNELMIQVTNALRRRELEIENRRHREELEKQVSQRTADLAESEKSYRRLMETMSEGLATIDEKGRFTYVNDRLCEMLQFSKSDLIGRQTSDFLENFDLEYWEQQVKLLGEKKHKRYDIVWRRKDGQTIDAIVSPRGIYDENGRYKGAVGVVTDITERRAMENALKREVEINAALAEASAKLVSKATLEDISTLVLEQAIHLTGSKYGFVGLMDPQTRHMLISSMTTDIWGQCEVEGATASFDHFSGLWGWVLDHRQPVFTNNPNDDDRSSGTPVGHVPVHSFLAAPALIGEELYGIVALANSENDYIQQDLAAIEPLAALYALAIQRNRQEDETFRDKQRLRLILDSIGVAVMIVDTETHVIMDLNPAAEKLIGAARDEIVLQECWDFVCPGKRDCCPINDLKRILENEEIDLIKADGSRIPILKTVVPITISGRSSLLETFTDVSDLKRAESVIQEQVKFLQTLIDTIPNPIFYKDRDGVYLGCNKAFEEFRGLEKEQVIGKTVYDIMPTHQADVITAIDTSLFENPGERVMEDTMQHSDGTQRQVIRQIAVFTGADDNPAGLVGIFTDITERKLMEDRLAKAARLESIGQLATGIAHEVNTPTQYIHGNLEFLQSAFLYLKSATDRLTQIYQQLENDNPVDSIIREAAMEMEQSGVEFLAEEIPEAIRGCLDGVDRITEIVNSMRYFAHPGHKEKSLIDVNQVIENSLKVSKNEWKYCARVKMDHPPDLPQIPALATEFNQAILNIIVNAAQAIKEYIGDNPERRGRIGTTTRKRGNHVEIRISDTGRGIPKEVRGRIFDPFFTTKDVGKGTGQGLAIAHSVIVEKHGGTIDFETKMDKGTTFIIRVPIEEGHLI